MLDLASCKLAATSWLQPQSLYPAVLACSAGLRNCGRRFALVSSHRTMFALADLGQGRPPVDYYRARLAAACVLQTRLHRRPSVSPSSPSRGRRSHISRPSAIHAFGAWRFRSLRAAQGRFSDSAASKIDTRLVVAYIHHSPTRKVS